MSVSPQRGRKVQPAKQAPSLRIFYIIIGLIAVAGAAWLITTATGQRDSTAEQPAAVPAQPFDGETGTTPEGFYYKGDPEAPVTVIEYADFQCPACANFATSDLYQRFISEYVSTGKVMYIYHDFPLSYHTNAPLAAEASYCAGEQGKYWEMHENIFRTQSQWSNLGNTAGTSFFSNLASDLELDAESFASCLSNNTYAEHIQQAGQESLEIGIPATPTFVVDGKQVSAAELMLTIDTALAEKGAS